MMLSPLVSSAFLMNSGLVAAKLDGAMASTILAGEKAQAVLAPGRRLTGAASASCFR